MEANNVKAMREALENSIGLLEELALIDEWGDSAKEQIVENRTALAAPLRNCDVGSAEEQYDRWSRFCRYRNAPLSQNRSCKGCPVYEAMYNCKSTCELIWAQMPYEGESDGSK